MSIDPETPDPETQWWKEEADRLNSLGDLARKLKYGDHGQPDMQPEDEDDDIADDDDGN